MTSRWLFIAMLGAIPAWGQAPMDGAPEPMPPATGVSDAKVRVALLQYAQGRRPSCFSTGFLHTVAEQAGFALETHFTVVDLAGPENLEEYPMLIWAGEGRFALSKIEQERLRHYLKQGGFILASAGCASAEWGDSFRQAFTQLWPGAQLSELTVDHPILHGGLFPTSQLSARRPTRLPLLEGWMEQGDLRLVYSAVGLHDTDHAGPGCCCCGGNELKDARTINANILHHVLGTRGHKGLSTAPSNP